MPERVKSRRYDSPRRREQAAATRLAILEAAERLFERDGYAATTMAAIAARGGRRAEDRLRGVRDQERRAARALAPAAARRRGGRPDRRAAVVPRGPGRARRRARGAPRRAPRAARQAAGGRPARGDPRRGAGRRRQSRSSGAGSSRTSTPTNARSSRRCTRRRCAPRASTSPARADILWTLNHPDVWRLLVGERGWTPEQWEQWFADTVCAQLLLASPS